VSTTPTLPESNSVKRRREGGCGGGGGGFMSLGLHDPDRLKRDSGVLVEEQDGNDSFNTTYNLPSYDQSTTHESMGVGGGTDMMGGSRTARGCAGLMGRLTPLVIDGRKAAN